MLGLVLKSLSQKACHKDDIIRILGSHSNRNSFKTLKGFSSSCPTYCLPDLSGQFELTFTIIYLFVLVCVVHTKMKWFVRVTRHKSQASLDILTKTKIHPSCSPYETCMCTELALHIFKCFFHILLTRCLDLMEHYWHLYFLDRQFNPIKTYR